MLAWPNITAEGGLGNGFRCWFPASSSQEGSWGSQQRGTTCCILLPGAVVVTQSCSVTFSMSKNPVRLFPCCKVASGKDFAQVKGQVPGLPSHLMCQLWHDPHGRG